MNNIYKLKSIKKVLRKVLIIVTMMLAFNFFENNAYAGNHHSLRSLTAKCIKLGELSTCRFALTSAEALQFQAASQGRYSCQTKLLGLQANLIMIILNSSNNKNEALLILNEVEEACKLL